MAGSDTPRTRTPKRAAKMAASQSMNHLLNFTLPPRQTQPTHNPPRRSRKPASHHVLWNQEKFVNAQYRFVMNPTESYAVHFADPDIFVQWEDVLQVIIPQSSALAMASSSGRSRFDEGHTSCPICLSRPIAPRMTKCGHVFCLACILHYLSTSERLKWVRCPICFDSVNEKQLKSVKWHDVMTGGYIDNQAGPSSYADSSSPPLQEGSSMRMRLMQRPRITTLSLPRSPTWPSDLITPHEAPFHFLPDVCTYAKIMLGTPKYLIADLTSDMGDLAAERKTLTELGDDVTFVDQAAENVQHQIAKIAALEVPHVTSAIERSHRLWQDIAERDAYHKRKTEAAHVMEATEVPHEFLAVNSVGSFAAVGDVTSDPPDPKIPASQLQSPSRGNKQRRNLNPPPPSTSTWSFYQAASGLPIFLHPLDIKILHSYFNDYASFPDEITLCVEAVSEGTVNDDLRKRCKYLAHMPENADVVFLEADLEGVVGPDGLRAFEGPLKMRKAKRREKERKDDRARARAEEGDRDKEREALYVAAYNTAMGGTSRAAFPSPADQPESPAGLISSMPDGGVLEAGAWGTRSFASTLRASAAGGRSIAQRTSPGEDEWGMDAAWHELGRNSGVRKKKGNMYVVLGQNGFRMR